MTEDVEKPVSNVDKTLIERQIEMTQRDKNGRFVSGKKDNTKKRIAKAKNTPRKPLAEKPRSNCVSELTEPHANGRTDAHDGGEPIESRHRLIGVIKAGVGK